MRLVTWHTPVPAPTALEPIDVRFPSRRAFLEHVQVGPASCRIFWGCAPRHVAGTRVLMRIRFASEAGFEVPGQVIQAREDLHGTTRPGLLVEVKHPGLFEFIRAYALARGNPPEFGRRAEERVAVNLPAVFTLGEERFAVRVRDLSRGGAFLEAHGANVLQGAIIQVSIRAGLLRRIEATGRVAWLGRRAQIRGFGLAFLELSKRSRKNLIETLTHNR